MIHDEVKSEMRIVDNTDLDGENQQNEIEDGGVG